MTRRVMLGVTVCLLTSISCATPVVDKHQVRRQPTIQLSPCALPRSSDTVLCGTHDVFEDRTSQAGRRIGLNIVVLPATGPTAAPDPLFVLIGGPGLGAASLATGDGISYGAQAALQYLRQHPRHVRSMAIVGVATPAAKQPLTFARAARDAIEMLIEDCVSDPACRGAFPSLTADFEIVLRPSTTAR